LVSWHPFALRHGRHVVLAVPWFWLLLFFAVPFFILLRISVTDMGEGLDPFAPLIETRDGLVLLHLKLANYLSLWQDADTGRFGLPFCCVYTLGKVC